MLEQSICSVTVTGHKSISHVCRSQDQGNQGNQERGFRWKGVYCMVMCIEFYVLHKCRLCAVRWCYYTGGWCDVGGVTTQVDGVRWCYYTGGCCEVVLLHRWMV